MANLNFYQPTQEKAAIKKEKTGLGSSLIAGLALILLPLAAWGGALFYGKQLDTSIMQTRAEISAAENALDEKIFSRVATFSSKVSEIENTSLMRDNPSEKIFNVIQANILKSGIKATEIKYGRESRELIFSFEADSFELVARQLMRLKSLNETFLDVEFVSSDRSDSGKIKCSFRMALK